MNLKGQDLTSPLKLPIQLTALKTGKSPISRLNIAEKHEIKYFLVNKVSE